MSDDIYIEANVPVFEAIYGKGLISLGGYTAVDNMFHEIKLPGKRLLDIGSGIGGMAHHLANKYNCQVTGLELYPWMAEYALRHTPKHIADKVKFITYDDHGNIPLDSQSIDIAYSKGVLTNVKDKYKLFSEIFRILTPNGKIIFVDWLVPETVGQSHEQLAMGDMSYKETQNAYAEILKNSGFSKIEFKDRSQEYLQYVKMLDTTYKSNDHIKKYAHIIDQQLRDDLIKSNLQLKQKIEQATQLSILIQAEKLC